MRARRISRADENPLELKFETLVDAIYFEAKSAQPAHGVTFIEEDGEEVLVTYLDALEKARNRAGALQKRGVNEAEPVVLVLPTTRDFLYLFFALQLVGAIPCPLAPPASFGEVAEFTERLRAIARYLGAQRLITTAGLRELFCGAIEGVEIVLMEDLRAEAGSRPPFSQVEVRGDDVALIQCTSGSTGLSKGVMLTHENLISNVYQIGWCVQVTAGDSLLSWLPLYHDMGLIGCLLFSLYFNLDSVFMSPVRFLRQPATWIQAISKHGTTMTTAPNFAYAYVAARAQERDLAGLDLSRWRFAGCGAEPIDRRTLERFAARLAPYGLRPNVLTPCYGLAEATLAVSFHEVGTPIVCDRVDRNVLAERGEAVDVGPDDPNGIEFVSCGRPMPESRVRIVDETWRELPENRVGRILVSGPTVMRGYYRLSEKTAEVFREGWLDTGDLGYLRGGALRITGREKDLVIIRGKKYFPSDFEWAAEEVDGVRKGNTIAFGRADPAEGTEVLQLVCETDAIGKEARRLLADEIARHVAARTGVRPAGVMLVARNTIPKTSSGKLQRRKLKDRFLSGKLATPED